MRHGRRKPNNFSHRCERFRFLLEVHMCVLAVCGRYHPIFFISFVVPTPKCTGFFPL